ncbi:hypothetical protein NL292_26235, partial [Klebsiella pneumoniae]|nr:hypothetical protein [Klebsiella pneumoniae]
ANMAIEHVVFVDGLTIDMVHDIAGGELEEDALADGAAVTSIWRSCRRWWPTCRTTGCFGEFSDFSPTSLAEDIGHLRA